MKVKLNNVGIINSCDVEFIPGINLIVGSSGSGKSTLLRSIHNIAVNEFSDSDISFGKDSMSVSVVCDNNIIEYSRFTKAKGDKFYYTVNGERYSKVGRQSLSAANDILKLGDIDINGDSINFNFNMQFSTPFLIFGSQSTLYNVLTYRSQFDISKINDCYNYDVKANNNEINTTLKVKDQLDATLADLQRKEKELRPVEELYSQYILYKHKSSSLEEINSLGLKISLIESLDSQLNKLNKTILDLQSLLSQITLLNDLLKYRRCTEEARRLDLFTHKAGLLETSYSNAESLSNELYSISMLNNKLLLCIKEDKLIDDIQVAFDKITSKLSNEEFGHNLISCYNKMTIESSLYKKVSVLSKLDNIVLSFIDDAIQAHKSISDLLIINTSISSTNDKLSSVERELSLFTVCPLCGSCLHQEHS